ncbi:hypothetical protein H4R18_005337 [Coemansia javaensis]|uniref:BRCA1-associated protein n=1 Tax=Coemansia javaensis TaxID=2761396 RepID=A0A9W8LEG5_9FUNG|nr:hypothetical protein H4R18_005337 [Coemansia javaensis]
MYFYTVYIGLACLAGPPAQRQQHTHDEKAREPGAETQRLDVFCAPQRVEEAYAGAAAATLGADRRPRKSAKRQQQQQQQRRLSAWLERFDYRVGRVQLEWWCLGEMPPEQADPVGVFEPAMAASCTYETGILRLYRSREERAASQDPAAAVSTEDAAKSSGARPDTLAVLAVPGYMAPTDFLAFTGPFADSIEHVRVIRDSSPSHYMILLKLRSVAKADEFYAYYNGKTFSPLEPETCHVVYVSEVRCEARDVCPEAIDWMGGAVGATPAALFLMPEAPSSGDQDTELPTCPVCLERLDSSVSGLLTTLCRHIFHCRCLERWGDGSCPVCRYSQMSAFVDHEKFHHTVAAGSRAGAEPERATCCGVCGRADDLWICLICGVVGCGRYASGHAKEHFEQTQHPYSMELVSQGVWDYAGDGYVHRLLQNMADRKVIALETLGARAAGADDGGAADAPAPGGTTAAGPAGAPKDRLAGPSYAGPESLVDAREKLAAVTQEYEALLVSQLEAQREHYEVQLARQNHQLAQLAARRAELERACEESQRRSADLERRRAEGCSERLAEAERSLARADEERREWAAERKRLEANASRWLKKSTEDARLLLEERAMARQLSENHRAQQQQIADLNAKLADLEDQVRDLTFFISTQKALSAEGAADNELQGASIAGIAEPPPPPRAAKGRRRR